MKIDEACINHNVTRLTAEILLRYMRLLTITVKTIYIGLKILARSKEC